MSERRCSGDCCRRFHISYNLDQFQEVNTQPPEDKPVMLAMLVELERTDSGAWYTCKNLVERDDGSGIGDCAIYDARPKMCRDYPHYQSILTRCTYKGCTLHSRGQFHKLPVLECENCPPARLPACPTLDREVRHRRSHRGRSSEMLKHNPAFIEAMQRWLEIPERATPSDYKDPNIERWRLAAVRPVNVTYLAPGQFIVLHPLMMGQARISISDADSPTFGEFWCFPDHSSAVVGLIKWLCGTAAEPDGWTRTTAGAPQGLYRRRSIEGATTTEWTGP